MYLLYLSICTFVYYSLARSQSYSDGLVEIFTQYGDHLYRYDTCIYTCIYTCTCIIYIIYVHVHVYSLNMEIRYEYMYIMIIPVYMCTCTYMYIHVHTIIYLMYS